MQIILSLYIYIYILLASKRVFSTYRFFFPHIQLTSTVDLKCSINLKFHLLLWAIEEKKLNPGYKDIETLDTGTLCPHWTDCNASEYVCVQRYNEWGYLWSINESGAIYLNEE